MLIDRARHFPGHHCASTGMRNLVSFHGFDWSEEFCFGLGCGLGIWYLSFPGLSPSRLVHVRSADLEAQFFRRIGYPFEWFQDDEPAVTEAALVESLQAGTPALLQTDIYYLPYYNSQTHFPGHVITAWGYDAQKQCFYVSDTEREGLLEVPFADMRKARYSSQGFFISKGNIFAPQKITLPKDIPAILYKAITDNSRALLDEGNGFSGVAALEQWLRELPAWGGFADWQWTVRFAYQVIEKRGTGGGGFRLLYKRFLEEASSFLPQISYLKLHALMADVAAAWTALAKELQKASEEPVFNYEPIAAQLKQVHELELTYHCNALKLQA